MLIGEFVRCHLAVYPGKLRSFLDYGTIEENLILRKIAIYDGHERSDH